MANSMRTFMLMTVLTVLFVWLGGAMGGRTGAIFALVAAGGMNFYSYWFSHKMVLKHYRAQEIGPEEGSRLYNIVAGLVPNSGLPMPKVYIIHDPSPNAFATGRNPENAAVAATTGIMDMLNDDELEGVMAHELAHIRNRDMLTGTIAATLAGAIAAIGQFARFGAVGRSRGSNPVAGLLLLIAAPLIAMIIRMAISRVREYEADKGGAEISGKPLGLAGALHKLTQGVMRRPVMPRAREAHSHLFIVNPFLGSGFKKLFATHPPMEERISRLQQMAGQFQEARHGATSDKIDPFFDMS